MESLKRLGPFMRPYWHIILLLVITVILPVAMELVVPRQLRVIIDDGIRQGDMNVIVQSSLLMLLAAFFGALAALGQGVCRALLSQGLAFDMREALFGHVQSLSFANLDRMQTGELITRLAGDVDIIRAFMSHGLALLLRALLMIAGSVLFMFIIDWQLALIMLVLLPLAGLLIWTVMHLAQPMFLVVQEKLSLLNTVVQENLAGVQVIKAFVRERFEIGRFAVVNEAYMNEHIRVGRLLAIALPVLGILTNLGIVAVLWFGGLSVIGERLSIGQLVAFTSYLMIGMAPLLLLGNILTMVSRAQASTERVFEVMDVQAAIRVPEPAHTAPVVQGRVIFDDISFGYQGNNNGASTEKVLDHLSLVVEPGQQIALLGATGSGKSTLVNLIPRFYDVGGGQLLVDGIDVRDWDPKVLRSRIGVVLQQTTLFSGTVRENIAYGRPDAPLEEVIAAAEAAQAHDFILAMPEAYDSLVEERGANLSGGQKQRIAIARALLISPRILILDDSTSAVDLETEANIQRALDNLIDGATTFVVAQRINSVLNADQILVLDAGQIAARGTHRELLESSPIYQEIFRSQLGHDQLPLDSQSTMDQQPQ
ncbi:MAG: ABC transporter ATP-binding protein [Chloroflexota bacterium]|nr:ABC transporter ATP-binding protein [Chloroflexota bacterium]